MFLYCNVSTLNPMVGIVITSSSSASFWSLYRIVVLPALSNPRINIRTSCEPKSDWKTREKRMPMVLWSRSVRVYVHAAAARL